MVHAHQDKLPYPGAAVSASRVEHLSSDGETALVVETVAGGRAVGSMLVYHDPDRGRVFVAEVEVDDEWKRKGVATAMLRVTVGLFPGAYYSAGDGEGNTAAGNAWLEAVGIPGRLRPSGVRGRALPDEWSATTTRPGAPTL